MNDTERLAEFHELRKNADLVTSLEASFFETEDYRSFRNRVFTVLTLREARMKMGRSELKGAALIGAPGIGKTRMVERIGAEYRELAEMTADCNFGTAILSVTVPGRATIKETCYEVLSEMGYDILANRTEDYLIKRVAEMLELHRIAALHLDEVQDSGRYLTSESMKHFAVRIRNFMQRKTWPVCIIVTGTQEAKTIINQDRTLLRRLRPIEVLPMVPEKDGRIAQDAIKQMLADNNLSDEGLLNETEFLKILIHASDLVWLSKLRLKQSVWRSWSVMKRLLWITSLKLIL